MLVYSPFQIREIFHLEFLRWFSRKVSANSYGLKGGANLRFFFESRRYSEDMDLDIERLRVESLKKTVLEILLSRGFGDSLRSFGIQKIIPPDLSKAKQTETTQRFKVHLLTSSNIDLFTKIEFSRRERTFKPVVESVSTSVLRSYKMPPLLIPHYDGAVASQQKVFALARRTSVQARDVFDLFILSSREFVAKKGAFKNEPNTLQQALTRLYEIQYPEFRDTVVAYLDPTDQNHFSSPAILDEIKIRVADFLKEFE